MPAPAVYVLAIVGTVGAVLAFKEFVYEPHIAPHIDRWKQEYQAARDVRRRRQAMLVSQDGSDLLMSETRKKSKSRASDKFSDDDDSDGEEDHGKGGATTGTSHSFMKDGLLIRRPILPAKKQADVELDTLSAHEVNPWRNEGFDQVLRQRKNVSEHAMDESIQHIPYAPLAPHVIFDASAHLPSPPNSDVWLSSPLPRLSSSVPPEIVSPPPTGVVSPESPFVSKSETPQEPANPIERVAETAPSLHSSTASLATPSPSLPEITASQYSVTQSTSLGASTVPTLSYHQIIPSLSQSYPQDLDYEHDLELLSPPSSRADSPFSLAALSPIQENSSRPLSALSSTISSPSPLRMGLGNRSYDAISPIPQIQLSTPNENASTTNSVHSTAYLSFEEDSSDDGSDVSLGTGVGGDTIQQPVAQYPTPVQRSFSANASSPSSASSLPAPMRPEGLGLFPISPREPRTPVAASLFYTVNASVNVTAGARDPSYFRASTTSSASASPSISASSYFTPDQFGSSGSDEAVNVSAHASAVQSDNELSDLDFMSDYQASEVSEISDLGEVSDESWSVAGGSEAGMSPRVGPVVGQGRAASGGRMWRA